MKIFSEPYMLVQYVGGSVAELSHFSLAPAPDIIFLALAPGKKYRLLLHLLKALQFTKTHHINCIVEFSTF